METGTLHAFQTGHATSPKLELSEFLGLKEFYLRLKFDLSLNFFKYQNPALDHEELWLDSLTELVLDIREQVKEGPVHPSKPQRSSPIPLE